MNQLKSVTYFNEPNWRDKEKALQWRWLKILFFVILFCTLAGFFLGMYYGVTKPRTREESKMFQEFPIIKQERDVLKTEKLSCLSTLFSTKQY